MGWRVCAWCGKRLDEMPDFDGPSHGICGPCMNGLMARSRGTVRSLLDGFAFPIAIIDAEGIVRAANESYRVKHRLASLSAIEGRPPGDGLRCYHAEGHGCGHSEACDNCVVRVQITRAIETGKPFHNESGYIETKTTAGIQKQRVNVSGAKVGDYVELHVLYDDDAPGQCRKRE